MNPAARLCAYGLYAPLNDGALRDAGIDVVLGVEFEADLVDVAAVADAEMNAQGPRASAHAVAWRGSRSASRPRERCRRFTATRTCACRTAPRRVAGYTEASRGCKHWCRHCPVVPVYRGQFRVVPVDVVIADIAAAGGAGATHITFGDPDFLNGPRHARAVVEALARALRRAHLRRDDQGGAPGGATPRCCPSCGEPAACSSPARSSRSTTACCAGSSKGHTARTPSVPLGLP